MKTITLQVPDNQVEEVTKFAEERHFELFVEDDADFEIPEWQKDEVRRRLKEAKNDPSKRISWEDAEKMLLKKWEHVSS